MAMDDNASPPLSPSSCCMSLNTEMDSIIDRYNFNVFDGIPCTTLRDSVPISLAGRGRSSSKRSIGNTSSISPHSSLSGNAMRQSTLSLAMSRSLSHNSSGGPLSVAASPPNNGFVQMTNK